MPGIFFRILPIVWLLPVCAYAQTGIVSINTSTGTPAKPVSTQVTLSSPVADWVIDIGTCPNGINCKTSILDLVIGPTVRFEFDASSTIQQGDVSIGSAHPNSWGRWNFNEANKVSFYFKDLNTTAPSINGNGDSQLYHYMLVYDNRRCYRQWLFNHPSWNGGKMIRPGTLYEITAKLRGTKGVTFYNQSGVPTVCADASIFNFSRIEYFEIGVFGPNVIVGGRYKFQVGPVFTTK